MNLLIVNRSSARVPRKFLTEWCGGIEAELLRRRVLKKRQTGLELTVVFMNLGPARKTNLRFRGKNYATDVLSFDSMASDSLGELVLCPEVLRRQASEHDLTYREELGYMLLHGILHLLGYDHETGENDARKMFKIQDEVFARLLLNAGSK